METPAWMRENARRGIRWYQEGFAGDGLRPETLSEAREMAGGNVTEEKAVRMAAWFARHMGDITGVPSDQDPPTPGMVAHALWGGWPREESLRAQRWAQENTAEKQSVPNRKENDTTQPQEEHNSMNFKTYKAELQPADETGTVEALVSVFGNIDYAGDRIVPGAFSKTLEDYAMNGRTIPFVWSHDYDTPESYIGKVIEATETSEGLRVKAQLFESPRAQVVRELLVNRVVNEFSFAYEIVNQQKAQDGANELTELRILECGPTMRGANPMTRLIDAKNASIHHAELPDNYRSALSEDVPEGRACGNCAFYDEENTREDGEKVLAFCTRWDDYVDGSFYCNAWQANQDSENSQKQKHSPELQNEKAGRTLSSKNEVHLRSAQEKLAEASAALEDVLNSINEDTAKTEEPETKAKVQEPVRDPNIALALIQLTQLD
jgi:HK97 family phage prohead protease